MKISAVASNSAAWLAIAAIAIPTTPETANAAIAATPFLLVIN